MKKIVINACFGGFGLSEKAVSLLGDDYNCEWEIQRDDPELVRVVEALGAEANGKHAELKVIQIPDDVDWEINEYDGNEHVAEKHRTWR
jgi:hypothetical protein